MPLLMVIATIVLSASTCKKMEHGDYHDFLDNRIDTLTKSFPEEMYSPDRLIIMYDEEVGKEPLLKAVKEYEAEIIYDYSIIPGIAIRIPEGTDIRKAMAFFKKVKGVVSVERDRIYRLIDPVRPRVEVQ